MGDGISERLTFEWAAKIVRHDAKTQALTAGRLHLVDPIGAVVVKRRGDGNPARSLVVLELDDFLTLLEDKR